MKDVYCNGCGWWGISDALVAISPGGERKYCPECGSDDIVYGEDDD